MIFHSLLLLAAGQPSGSGNTTPLLTAIHVEANIGLVVSLLFPVITRFYWPWNESWWGWNTILLELSISGTILPSVLTADFSITDVPLEIVRLISLAAVVINVLWRIVMIWRTQRKGAAALRVSASEAEEGQPVKAAPRAGEPGPA